MRRHQRNIQRDADDSAVIFAIIILALGAVGVAAIFYLAYLALEALT